MCILNTNFSIFRIVFPANLMYIFLCLPYTKIGRKCICFLMRSQLSVAKFIHFLILQKGERNRINLLRCKYTKNKFL